MSQKNIKDVSASIRQKLLNKARQDQRPFAELLQYFAMERFLYRLTKSKYNDKFILKGALALLTWNASTARPTKDIDLLGVFDNNVDVITQVITDICNQEIDTIDGLVFDVSSITGIQIKEDADYQGVRVKFLTFLDTARVTMQIDIGFGDAINPEPETSLYPTLLDLPAPEILSYSKETIISEKLEAMAKLGELNSRMKDFYDIWLLSRQFQFDGMELEKAITGTFSQRNTVIQADIEAFSESFAKTKDVQWKAFINKLDSEAIPLQLKVVILQIKEFLQPILKSILKKSNYTKTWLPESGWRDAK